MPNFELLGLIISGCALSCSIYSIRRQVPSINVTWENMDIFPESEIFANGKPWGSTLKKNFYLSTRLIVINESSFPIGYFDLRAFDPKTNANFHILTRQAIPYPLQQVEFQRKFKIKNTEAEYNLEIPVAKHGMFPASSCTSLDLLVWSMDYEAESRFLCLSFKIPKKRYFHKYRYSDTNRNKYKVYDQIWDLSKFNRYTELTKNIHNRHSEGNY